MSIHQFAHVHATLDLLKTDWPHHEYYATYPTLHHNQEQSHPRRELILAARQSMLCLATPVIQEKYPVHDLTVQAGMIQKLLIVHENLVTRTKCSVAALNLEAGLCAEKFELIFAQYHPRA